MDVKVSASVVGDYGNPSGSGVAKMQFARLPHAVGDMGTLQTDVQTFHSAVKTAQLTETVLGDITTSVVSENFPAKPGTGVNVDRRLEYTWRTKTNSAVRGGTLHGVPATSTGIDKLPQGERLNDTGKVALAGAIASLYGIVAPDEVIVLQGKVLQKA